ncbi:MAG: SAM-dependent chlorinase/fluorinase [Erysipelotrichaceae bacterium]|nr:SAM-dependent chlorinase/fluorinase [Erysipelotrichaceae bacterium]
MKPCIVWQTDFSLDWPFVATMKGVCKQIDDTLDIIDSSHTIDKFNILEASQQLDYVEPFYPKGTIYVSVVDPGVGTNRKASVAKLKDGNYVITPDNGTLTHLFYHVGIEEIREIDSSLRYQGTENVSVFHGRDIFAYVAAKLASQQIIYEETGNIYPVDDIVLLDYQYLRSDVKTSNIDGIVSNVSDPFGSIVFNVLTEDFKRVGYQEGEYVHITLAYQNNIYFDEDVLYEKSFGFVEIGKPILFNASSNYMSLGLNQASFKDRYKVHAGMDYKVHISKASNHEVILSSRQFK